MVKALLLAAFTAALFPRAAAADDFDALRSEFLARINAERAHAGVAALRVSPALSRLAQQLAGEAERRGNGELAETSEGQILQRAEKAGYSAKSLAEIFTHSDGTIADVTAHWRERGDRTWKTLLRREFQDVGVGAAMLDEVPLYVLLLGLSWDDYAAGRSEEYRDLSRIRRQMLARVDAERSRRSLPLLAPNVVLDRVAQAYADDMLRRSYYGHESPDGKTVRERGARGRLPAALRRREHRARTVHGRRGHGRMDGERRAPREHPLQGLHRRGLRAGDRTKQGGIPGHLGPGLRATLVNDLDPPRFTR